ncbi:hypothetical protein BDN70DRAFT_938218 [Pholiota conissans]|uniref:Nephrocystin 3-like N-terminal domain-containing protein n=1 Tax=Pholiota conissans TaxID=109636 RepID=A0A9P6CMK8_9AGAR|nr:hypothetical protein BDN70DRAFT_938218 [Pholiota conissans]
MSCSSQQMFSNANNLGIHGGQFSNVQGDMHVHSAAAERHGLKLLLQNISPGALHDAAERDDQPGCHENTRVAIRKEIMDWLQKPGAREKFVLWLYGPVGSGKTSIAQSIAEALAELGLLAASFFFRRSAAGRNTSDRFIATIAYQLSCYFPVMADLLYTAIEKDPIIFSKLRATQLQLLIVHPLKAALQYASPLTTPKPIVIIVDGVDECLPAKSQVELLGLLQTIVGEFQSIPFLCFVSSRPEYEIRSTFAGSNLFGALTTKIALKNNNQTFQDIKFFLLTEFSRIRDENLQIGTELPSPWPANHDVDNIAEKASGQFIFASTVMKFVSSSEDDPVERLNIIMGLYSLGPGQRPFDPLDDLYRTILASISPNSLPKVLDILSLIISAPELQLSPSVWLAGGLLELDIRKTLIRMHALVHVPPPKDKYPMYLYHKSFEDFVERYT